MNFRFKKAQKLKQQRDSERVRDYFDDDDEEDVLASGGVSSGVSGGVSGGVRAALLLHELLVDLVASGDLA